MAKALQTDQWSSQWRGSPRPMLRYDRELIAKSMSEVELQDARWLRWFELHNITPFRVTYEDLTADPAAVVRGVVEQLGVQDDEPDDLKIPAIEKQGDDTNQEWIERFVREARADAEGRAVAAMGGSASSDKGDFFERYEGLIKRLPEGSNSATGFVGAIRLRRRYEALVWQNRALFRNARVLDLISLDGFWSVAALDAGAAHVVAVETSRQAAETGATNLAELGVDSGSYRFINSKIFAALEGFAPQQFDVILCKGFVEYCQSAELFLQLSRLRPKHVILDTRITPGDKPISRFALAKKSMKGRKGRITSTPTHELITFLSQSDFRCRLVDWQAMIGAEDWTGVPDYARDIHRTYVLDRLV
jgi:2-polyprenyl-3-methyl-5-hydroxy-6-metoxy-1,4-benzoquinol methylase